MNRSFHDAMANAARLKAEIPHLIQPEATSFDMVILADAANTLIAIAQQRLSLDMDTEQWTAMNFEDAYNSIIEGARLVVTPKKANP